MRRIRKAKKLTQEQVAESANLHPNYISSVERAERNISIRNIERIAVALDVKMAKLVDEQDPLEESVFSETEVPERRQRKQGLKTKSASVARTSEAPSRNRNPQG